MINTLNNRNENNNLLDYKIKNLESTVVKLRKEAQDSEKQKESLRNEIKKWKEKYDYEKHEKESCYISAKDAKRKNKLLKVAVGRLQNEYDRLKDKY